MQVNGVKHETAGTAGIFGMPQSADEESARLGKEIEDRKARLQAVADDEKLSAEQKMKKRQELQKEISALEGQLRQHEIELRRERMNGSAKEADGDKTAFDALLGDGEKRMTVGKGKENAAATVAISDAGMRAMLSADASMKLADVQGSVKTALTGHAGVLEAEIKTDRGRGGNIEKKEAELSDTLEKANAVTAGTAETLRQANDAVAEARKEEAEEKKTDEKETRAARDKGVTKTAADKNATNNAADGNVPKTAEDETDAAEI